MAKAALTGRPDCFFRVQTLKLAVFLGGSEFRPRGYANFPEGEITLTADFSLRRFKLHCKMIFCHSDPLSMRKRVFIVQVYTGQRRSSDRKQQKQYYKRRRAKPLRAVGAACACAYAALVYLVYAVRMYGAVRYGGSPYAPVRGTAYRSKTPVYNVVYKPCGIKHIYQPVSAVGLARNGLEGGKQVCFTHGVSGAVLSVRGYHRIYGRDVF